MRYEATKPRRAILRWIAAAPAFVFLRSRAADGKAKKADMHYQDKPKDGQLCGNCIHFQAPDQCDIVEGKISPAGWCIEFQKKQ